MLLIETPLPELKPEFPHPFRLCNRVRYD